MIFSSVPFFVSMSIIIIKNKKHIYSFIESISLFKNNIFSN